MDVTINYFLKLIFGVVNINNKLCLTFTSTMCIRELDLINLILWFDFRLDPIFATTPVAPKILLASKMVKSDKKITIYLILPRFSPNP